jgi:hypothetical protein
MIAPIKRGLLAMKPQTSDSNTVVNPAQPRGIQKSLLSLIWDVKKNPTKSYQECSEGRDAGVLDYDHAIEIDSSFPYSCLVISLGEVLRYLLSTKIKLV